MHIQHKVKWFGCTFLTVCVVTTHCFRDCRQITSVTLNRFCPLSNSPAPVLNGQYQNGYNTNLNQMKNTCPCNVFQVLKVLLYENLYVRSSHQIFCFLLFLLAFTSADIIFHTFLELHSTLSEKKRFLSQLFLFWRIHLKPPPP